jgi:D-sedoheptulose 7-phosphate isomerase
MVLTTFSTSSEHLLDTFKRNHPAWLSHEVQLRDTVNLICQGYHEGVLILTCGYGGSAADASHIVGELVKSFNHPRPLTCDDQASFIDAYGDAGKILADHLVYGLLAVSLSTESITLPAMGNDVGFEYAQAQQVQSLGHAGDILIGLSTSGNSANVIAAMRTARLKDMYTIGLTGQTNCKLDEVCDIVFHAPATVTYRIQEHHLALYHAICLLVENQLFSH